ncbi:aldo-keto reductase family 1 member A1-like isoform X2 [Paramacrobiotus metropolitanus]|nr:aldo-keto reductase family 1 member A1-like isoform X2 [Paramacrobiotus metropolitanus]
MLTALELGYRHFDTALLYQNETEIGRVLAEALQRGQVTREELFITTKLWCTYNHPQRVTDGLRRSLDNLGLDYIDLFLIHMPACFQYVDEWTWTPRDATGTIRYDTADHAATWKELEKAVNAGLVRSIGLSAVNCRQVQYILDHCTITPANVQVENHAYLMQGDLFRLCSRHAIHLTAFSPLGSPDRCRADLPRLLDDPVVIRIAHRHAKTPGQVLLRFLLQRGRLVIPRSTSRQHLHDNLDVFDFALAPAEMQALAGLDRKGHVRYYPFDQINDSLDAPYAPLTGISNVSVTPDRPSPCQTDYDGTAL